MRAITLSAVLAATVLWAAPAAAADKIVIGYQSTLTGPAGIQGEEMVNSFKLALEHLDNKIGGLPVELIVLDDQQKPQMAVQNARRFIEKDKVDVMAGLLYSNITEAILNAVLPSGSLVVFAGGTASQRSGKECHENAIGVFWNIDTAYREIGTYLKKQGIKKPYLVALNIQPGKDAMNGFKLGFGAEVGGESYTRPDPSDFASEITEIRRVDPDAVVYFIPGGVGFAFMKQYVQAGLKDKLPPYGMTVQVDEMSFPALGDAALGLKSVSNWSPALDNPVNKRFVEGYRAKHGRTPTTLGAMAYDNAMLLDAGVKAVKGAIEDKAKLRDALRKVDFPSVRGKIRIGANNTPVQPLYLNVVEKNAGGALYNKLLEQLVADAADPHGKECALK
ncbi:MAG: ABC transporter substrate-binding protein [Rhodospirillales bacterium]|nr:ABC transporter substrate-binding protein [Rhodospirillales bacterium]